MTRSFVRLRPDWLDRVCDLIEERPDLEGIGVSVALPLAVQAI